MDNFRLFGVVAALLLAFYTLNDWRIKRRGEVVFGLFIALSVGTVSINPSIANILADFLQLNNRLFAVLVASTLILFATNFYLLQRLDKTREDFNKLVHALALQNYAIQADDISAQSGIFITIPAYMEEDNIEFVLSQLPEKILNHPVYPLIVVDGSYDKTEAIVQNLGHRVVVHPINRGQGAALKTGFEVALQESAFIIVTMDADGQHKVVDLPRLIQPILDDSADYVMGSRLLGVYEEQGGFRHAGIIFFSQLISWLIGQKITDCTNGFRAIRADKFADVQLYEQRFSAPEMIIQASRHNLRIQEIPVTIMKRYAGESKKPQRLGYPLRFGWALLRAWLRSG